MDELIQVHECNNMVDKQLKEDRKMVYNHEFARSNAIIDENIQHQYSILQPVQEHKLNVIIRKKEPKANLATFLHGACWSPVKNTFSSGYKEKSLHNLARSYIEISKAPPHHDTCDYSWPPAP